jgi:hypothetical protein
MHRYAIGVLCSIAMLAVPLRGQKPTLEPIHVAAGTVLTFHLQTRLHPAHENATDTLPRGTEIRVKILDSIDSNHITTEQESSRRVPLRAPRHRH